MGDTNRDSIPFHKKPKPLFGTTAFNPRILVATSGATNAGIDCDKIRAVFRLDMPSTRVDIVQERGQAGRFFGADPMTCSYDVNFSMGGFNYKLIQILSKKEKILDNTYRKEMECELLHTLKLLTIAPQCIALELEEAMANPDVPCTDEHPNACGNCFVCQKKIHGKEFKREEFKNLLFSVFCDR